MRSPIVRATRSTPPPGCTGAMILIGLFGYGCACTAGRTASRAASKEQRREATTGEAGHRGLLVRVSRAARRGRAGRRATSTAHRATGAHEHRRRRRTARCRGTCARDPARDSGSCMPPRMCGCRSSTTRPSVERHAHVAGVALRIRVVRIDDVADLRGEREHARIAHRFVAERVEAHVAVHERDRDVERRRELRRIGVRRAGACARAAPTAARHSLARSRRPPRRHPRRARRAPQASARSRCRAGSSSRSRRA